MPFPVPREDEDQETFIERCMSDVLMRDEFPDPTQRAAVCYSQWGARADHRRWYECAARQTEIRVQHTDGHTQLQGYAAVFRVPSLPLGLFVERVLPGAFTRTLTGGADVRALVEHDPSKILGRRKSGTLTLVEDEHGLLVTILLPDTTLARDVLTSVTRGDLDGMSFGFRTVQDRWITENGQEVRELVDVDLFDVSVVTYPAYPQTSIYARSAHHIWTQYQHSKRERISLLRKKITFAAKNA